MIPFDNHGDVVHRARIKIADLRLRKQLLKQPDLILQEAEARESARLPVDGGADLARDPHALHDFAEQKIHAAGDDEIILPALFFIKWFALFFVPVPKARIFRLKVWQRRVIAL